MIIESFLKFLYIFVSEKYDRIINKKLKKQVSIKLCEKNGMDI